MAKKVKGYCSYVYNNVVCCDRAISDNGVITVFDCEGNDMVVSGINCFIDCRWDSDFKYDAETLSSLRCYDEYVKSLIRKIKRLESKIKKMKGAENGKAS